MTLCLTSKIVNELVPVNKHSIEGGETQIQTQAYSSHTGRNIPITRKAKLAYRHSFIIETVARHFTALTAKSGKKVQFKSSVERALDVMENAEINTESASLPVIKIAWRSDSAHTQNGHGRTHTQTEEHSVSTHKQFTAIMRNG